MADMSTDDFMNKQKDALHKKREGVMAKRSELDDQISAIDGELARIDAYFGATAKPKKATKGKRGKASSGEPTLKDKLLDVIKAHPQGLTKSEVIDAWKAAGHPETGSLANQLSQMKLKDKTITQDDEKRYKAA